MILRIWCAGKASRLHAPRNSPLWGIFHKRDHDVLRVDFRHGNDRDIRSPSISSELPRLTQPKQIGEKPQVGFKATDIAAESYA